MKKYKIILLALIVILALAGCKKKDPVVIKDPIESTEEIVEPVPVEETETDQHKGLAQSKLTGEWISPKIANKRPYAIMINNIKYASPQAGTSQASILYEAVVEGGITRMMGIYEDFDAKKIGSTRSARHYFVSFADEYDAIFVHFGQTKYAVSKMKQLGTDNLSGLEGVGNTVFFRDNAIKAPHNAFASYEGIIKGTEEKKYRTEYEKDFEPQHYSFNEEDTDIAEGVPANKVTLDYSGYISPYFDYNSSEKLYYRSQFGTPHIDKNTGKQLAFKNVIVQYVKEWNIDKNGYQTMDIENSSGAGYYITNGKGQEITWKKNESTSKMHYYDKEGNILKVNPGKTFISIFPKERENGVTLSGEAK